MPEFTKDEALAFIASMGVAIGNRVGFRWLAERLSGLASYVETVSDENERMKAYLEESGMIGDYRAYAGRSSAKE